MKFIKFITEFYSVIAFVFIFLLNPLSTNPIKWWNTLKQFVSNLPTNWLSVFHHFVNLTFKGLSTYSVFLRSFNNYFCRWLAYKSLQKRFSLLTNYTMWSSNLFLCIYSLPLHSFFPRFSWFRFFRVQVFYWVRVFNS